MPHRWTSLATLLPLGLALPLALAPGMGHAGAASASSQPARPTEFCDSVHTICVGADSACQFTDIQDAIDAASSPKTLIVVASNKTYTNQHLVLHNRNVTLRGGYSSCSAWLPSGMTTLHGGTTHSVISISPDPGPTVTVQLENLDIRDGGGTDPIGFHTYSVGGGVFIQGNTSASIRRSKITHNSASYGGGIYLDGSDGAMLELQDVEISNNSASNNGVNGSAHNSGRGGGIYCTNGGDIFPDGLVVSGNVAVADTNSIAMGGGAYLHGCLFTVPAFAEGRTTFFLNMAQDGDGGGFYVSTAGSHVGILNLHGDSLLQSNLAGRNGGGVYADHAVVSLTKAPVTITNNTAGFSGSGSGGAMYLRNNGLDAQCDGNCELSGNSANGPGTAIYGFASSPPVEAVYFDIASMRIVGNGAPGQTVIDVGSSTGSTVQTYISLHNMLLAGNTGSTLFNVRTPESGELFVSSSTIADNDVGVDFSVGGDTLTHPPFWLYNSIVNEASGTYAAASTINVDVECVIAHQSNHLPSDDTLQVIDPKFVDADAGDYHLQPDSPAIDYCGHTDDVPDDDLDGNPRGVDAPQVPPFMPGATYDLGAYEWTAPDDTIFADGFD